jgi:hypothetical protein
VAFIPMMMCCSVFAQSPCDYLDISGPDELCLGQPGNYEASGGEPYADWRFDIGEITGAIESVSLHDDEVGHAEVTAWGGAGTVELILYDDREGCSTSITITMNECIGRVDPPPPPPPPPDGDGDGTNCQGPPLANQGKVSFNLSSLIVCLGWKRQFSVNHGIVTRDTPRQRDLKGKLKIEKTSGTGDVKLFKDGSEVALPFTMNIVEPGHSGCGVHNWHNGTENFELFGQQTGSITLKATVDPDPDDGGDGLPVSVTVGLTVATIALNSDPIPQTGVSAKTAWSEQEAASRKANITVVITPPSATDALKDRIALTVKELKPADDDDRGMLTQDPDNKLLWHYEAYEEDADDLHPAPKQAVIVAKCDGQEIGAPLFLNVRPVFQWLTDRSKRHQHGLGGAVHFYPHIISDYQTAYNYIRWKYNCLDGVGDGFTTVNFVLDDCVPCGALRRCRAACTSSSTFSRTDDVTFGLETFLNENWAASTIGHELVHTTGTGISAPGECEAYSWEVNNTGCTGLDSSTGLDDIIAKQQEACQ